VERVDIFKRLGHPKHTDAVYAILEQAEVPLPVAHIAKDASVSRMVVYRILRTLMKDDLVRSVTVGRRIHYELTSPSALARALRCHDEVVEKVANRTMAKLQKQVPKNVRFLYGPEGIRAAFDDVISRSKKGDTFFRYTSEVDLDKVNSYLASDYRVRRDRKKLERQVISNPLAKRQKRPRLERFIKFIPADTDTFLQNIIELIYGDCVSFIDLSKEEVMIIENKQLADFQKVIFKLLYKQLPQT